LELVVHIAALKKLIRWLGKPQNQGVQGVIKIEKSFSVPKYKQKVVNKS
jgi:hypothetical protein